MCASCVHVVRVCVCVCDCASLSLSLSPVLLPSICYVSRHCLSLAPNLGEQQTWKINSQKTCALADFHLLTIPHVEKHKAWERNMQVLLCSRKHVLF